MKMKRFKWQIAFGLIILLVSCISSREGASKGAHGLSPFSFGLSEARNGVERYQVLLKNVRIKNLTVNLTGGADYLYVFNTNSDGKKVNGLDYISDIAIDGLVVVPDKGSLFRGMALSNVQLNTAKSVECTVQNMEVKQTAVKKQTTATSTKTAVLKANIPLKSGKAVLKNVAGLKQ